MFNRFRDSLVYPSRIINYRKDKLIRVIGYMLLFAAIASIPAMAGVYRIDSIPISEQETFEENLIPEEIPCVLNSGILTCDTPVNTIFYEDELAAIISTIDVRVGVSDVDFPISEVSVDGLQIMFTSETVDIYYAGTVFEMPYDELPSEFSSLDFNDVKDNPEEFTASIMEAINAYVKSVRPLLLTMTFFIGFIMYMVLILFVVFMNATMLKMRFKVIPFKETFIMGVYMGTTLYILLIMNVLFGFGLFMIVLFLILSFRQTNAVNMEIMKRMKK